MDASLEAAMLTPSNLLEKLVPEWSQLFPQLATSLAASVREVSMREVSIVFSYGYAILYETFILFQPITTYAYLIFGDTAATAHKLL
jgi:hypothetical protein